MAILSRFAAAVVVSSIFSSVLTAIPAVAATETGLSGLYPHAQQPRANRHETIAKSRRSRKAKRANAKTGVCQKKSSSAAPSSTPAPTSTAAPTSSEKPSTTSSKKPDPTPEPKPDSPPPASYGGNKIGLAWNTGRGPSIEMFLKDNVGNRPSWHYTWSVWPASDNIEPVPMLWGISKKAEFDKNFPKGAKFMLGFNEPDWHDQSNLDPTYAAHWWRDNVAHKYGVAKITPATTGGLPSMAWMKTFLAECHDCDWAGMAIHYYGTNSKGFIEYATTIHNTFGMDLWVTEIACQNFGGGAQCSEADNSRFVQETVDWMQATPWIKRYSFFGTLQDMYNVNEKCRLMDASGTWITPLGKQLFAIP